MVKMDIEEGHKKGMQSSFVFEKRIRGGDGEESDMVWSVQGRAMYRLD